MLPHLDNLLRHLFLAQVPGITSEEQVRFQPPDQDWRMFVSGLGVQNALNIYLVELRENRKLRTNERVREIQNGIAIDTPAPRRIDCHYLITAWSPASVTTSIEPTIDEHALLYDVTAVLMNHECLVPRKVYAPDPLPAGFPELIADVELPMTILPVESFPKYPEFGERWEIFTLGNRLCTSWSPCRSHCKKRSLAPWSRPGLLSIGSPALRRQQNRGSRSAARCATRLGMRRLEPGFGWR